MRKIILFIFALSLLSNLVSAALTIEIDIKDSFVLGETSSFDYTIYSDSDQTITFIPHIDCPNTPIPFLIDETINLKAEESYTDSYLGITIYEAIEPQTCTAYVQILSPTPQKTSKNFTIATDPSFLFALNLCKDQACTDRSKAFIQNEDVYLDYTSEVPSPSITATLTLPDQTTQDLTLPTSIKAGQLGAYALAVTASKAGFKTASLKEQFAVIVEQAEIIDASVCNEDGDCTGEENSQNCPQDCAFEVRLSEADRQRLAEIEQLIRELEGREKGYTNYIIFGGILLIFVAIIVYLEKGRRKKDDLEVMLELKSYITANLKRGNTADKMKKDLIKDGWNKKIVDNALKSLGK